MDSVGIEGIVTFTYDFKQQAVRGDHFSIFVQWQ